MQPTKKLHTETSTKIPSKKSQPLQDEDSDEYDDSGHDKNDNQIKTQRKRRTKDEASKRDFICGCGRSYVSYPAIYLHIKNKHNSIRPPDTIIPENDEKEKVKRGRPKKEKEDPTENVEPIVTAPEEDEKLQAEDDFWLFIGNKGSTNNTKTENKLIKAFVADSTDAPVSFVPQEVFQSEVIYYNMVSALKENLSKEPKPNVGFVKRDPSGGKLDLFSSKDFRSYDSKLGHFILWIATPMTPEFHFEIATIIYLFRTAMLVSIWTVQNPDLISIKEDQLEIKVALWKLIHKLTKPDAKKMLSFVASNVGPLLTNKWSEIRKSLNGKKILENIISETLKDRHAETLFEELLKTFSDEESDAADKIAEAILNLKETEVKESINSKKKFVFLNSAAKDDLKELIQKISNWLIYFKQEDYNLDDTDCCFT